MWTSAPRIRDERQRLSRRTAEDGQEPRSKHSSARQAGLGTWSLSGVRARRAGAAAVGGPNGDNAGRDTQLVCLLPKPGDILNSTRPEELAPAPLPAGRVVWEARLLPT